jgi:hypothetical protein
MDRRTVSSLARGSVLTSRLNQDFMGLDLYCIHEYDVLAKSARQQKVAPEQVACVRSRGEQRANCAPRIVWSLTTLF